MSEQTPSHWSALRDPPDSYAAAGDPAGVLFQARPAGGDQRPLLHPDPQLERAPLNPGGLSPPQGGPQRAAALVHGRVPAASGAAAAAAPPEQGRQDQEEPQTGAGGGLEAAEQDGADLHRCCGRGNDWHILRRRATLPPLLPGEGLY